MEENLNTQNEGVQNTPSIDDGRLNSQSSQEQGNPETTPVQNKEPSFVVPEEYKEKGWAQKIKTENDLWKQLSNAQSLIGKKTIGVPDEKASEEEWEEFNKKMANDKTEYEFDESINSEDREFYKSIFVKNGINKRAGDQIIKAYNDYMNSKISSLKNEEDFKNKAQQTFGDLKVLGEVEKVINKYSSEEEKSVFNTFTNEQLLTVVKMINSIKNDYGINLDSKLNSGKNEAGSNVPSKEKAQSLAKELFEKQNRGNISAEEKERLMNAILKANGVL